MSDADAIKLAEDAVTAYKEGAFTPAQVLEVLEQVVHYLQNPAKAA